MDFSSAQDWSNPPDSPAKGSPLPCQMTLSRNFCSEGMELYIKRWARKPQHLPSWRVESDGEGST